MLIVVVPPTLRVDVAILVEPLEVIASVRVELVTEKAGGVIVPFNEPVMSNVEPLRTNGPTIVPRLGNANVLPFVTVVVPVNVFAPERTSVPAPSLVMPNPTPVIGPRVRVFAPTFMIREPV